MSLELHNQYCHNPGLPIKLAIKILCFKQLSHSKQTKVVNYLGDNVAGVWTMDSPIITSANFGSFSYVNSNFTEIALSFKYNNFKYEKSLF